MSELTLKLFEQFQIGKEQGIRLERERIIALLESKAFRHGCEESATTGCSRCHIGIHDAVQLIKVAI